MAQTLIITPMLNTPLPDLVVLLAAAVVIVAAFRALRLSPVLGYLVAGAVIGPSGLGWIGALDVTSAIGELGIVFLLFMIGLDLSWDRLKAMRGQVFGLGTLQVILTGAVFMGLAHSAGLNLTTALIVGGGLALSSTAIVLEVLRERREIASQTGRLSFAILILQDLAVLPLLVLVPLIAENHGSLTETLATSTARAVAALAVIIVVGRLLLRPLFRLIARLDIHELFVAAIFLVVLGLSWATESAGLSMALGAFIAGLLIAETEFQHQVEADVKPYKALLMGLFFMTVGMKTNLTFIIQYKEEILLIAVGIITIKSLLLFGLLRILGYGKRTSGHTALLLAQGGEFAFILFGLAAALGVMEGDLSQKLLLAITLTMAATPLLDTLGMQFEKRWWRRVRRDPKLIAEEARDLDGHVVLAGYGRMARLIADHLAQENIKFVALDTDPREVSAGRMRHHPVYYGDAARPDVLEAIGVSRAVALVITLHDPDAADKLLRAMRTSYPDLPIMVRARDLAHVHALELMGATKAVPELQVSSMRLLSGLLKVLNRPEEEIQRVMSQMR